jgi:acyl-CoA hydrolase
MEEQFRTSETKLTTVKKIQEEHVNAQGRLRVGLLLKMMDAISCMSAEHVCSRSMVTAALSDLQILAYAKLGQLLTLEAYVTRTFGSSLEVYVAGYVQSPSFRERHRRSSTEKVQKIDIHGTSSSSSSSQSHPRTEKLETPDINHRSSSLSSSSVPSDAVVKLVECSFVYVVLRDDSVARVPIRLPAIVPDSALTQLQFDEAGERRALRARARNMTPLRDSVGGSVLRKSTAESTDGQSDDGAPPALASSSSCWSAPMRRVSVADSTMRTVELVLPQHANHHGSVFGGHLMQLMQELSELVAARHVGDESRMVLPIHCSDFAFVAPGRVGDRLYLVASVTRTFGSTAEVGIRCEAWSRPTTTVAPVVKTHVNSAFITYLAASSARVAASPNIEEIGALGVEVPRLRPSNADERRRYARAMVRRQIRLARTALRSSSWHQVAMPCLDGDGADEVAPHVIFANVTTLLDLEARANRANGWWLVQERDGVQLHSREHRGVTLARVYFSVEGAEPARVFAHLVEPELRRRWDHLYAPRVIATLDEHNDIVHAKFGNDASGRDFVLLRSQLVPASPGDYQRYVLANRSVEHGAAPPLESVARGHVQPTGWLVRPASTSTPERPVSRVSFILQLGPTALVLVLDNLTGKSSDFVANVANLRNYLQSNSGKQLK